MSPKKRTRRTPEQRIADLQAEIEKVKARAAQAKAKKDPALRHISGAVRSIDKALEASKDSVTRTALQEARATLASCLTLNGVTLDGAGSGAKSSAGPRPDADRVLDYIREHPGCRSEEMCSELNTTAASLRPVLHELRDNKKVKVDGKARATRYTAKK